MLLTPDLLLPEIRARNPLVHCITNYVAMNFAANALLAVGASPAMVHAQEEAGEFVEHANALTINIGTLSPVWLAGMEVAAQAAGQAQVPWVLDPVAHFATSFRRQAVGMLLALKPAVIRGNASEIIALAGGQGGGQGVDSGDTVSAAEEAARRLAHAHKAVVAVTGPVDFVCDAHQAVRIHGGAALMPKVTALGCALTAVVGAFIATRPHAPFETTVAALCCFAAAGAKAAHHAAGPGQFAVRFLDALYTLDAAELKASERISVA